MFFQSMNQMMTPNVDITLVIRKSADGCMSVSVLPKSNTLKDEAQNNIVPMTLNGMPEELDSGFFQAVYSPVQKVSGLITNMARFEAQAEKAVSASKGARDAKSKVSKEEKDKQEKYEKNLKKAQELIAAKKHMDAVEMLNEARKYAGEEELKKIDGMLEEQKKLAGQGDLFAMMDEPEPVPQVSQQPQVMTPKPTPQAQPVTGQVPPAQQPQAPQYPASVPQSGMPQGQQPYGNAPAGYNGQYGYSQQPQGWPQPQQGYPDNAYPRQYANPANAGGRVPDYGQQGAYQQHQNMAYPQQPMPSERSMPPQGPAIGVSDDVPSYRPEEYAGYPDFPESMLQDNNVQS